METEPDQLGLAGERGDPRDAPRGPGDHQGHEVRHLREPHEIDGRAAVEEERRQSLGERREAGEIEGVGALVEVEGQRDAIRGDPSDRLERGGADRDRKIEDTDLHAVVPPCPVDPRVRLRQPQRPHGARDPRSRGGMHGEREVMARPEARLARELHHVAGPRVEALAFMHVAEGHEAHDALCRPNRAGVGWLGIDLVVQDQRGLGGDDRSGRRPDPRARWLGRGRAGRSSARTP
jgi:hypothetical protein